MLLPNNHIAVTLTQYSDASKEGSMRNKILWIVVATAFCGALPAWAVDVKEVDALVSAQNINVVAVKNQGQGVMPVLAKLYTDTDDQLKRAKIAWLFYQLSWKSEDAKNALMQDIDTDNQELRLQVQWALGRVSDDVQVVDALVDNFRNDSNFLFREKAACALASDQIHLSPQQRVHLLEELIKALDAPEPQVRGWAIQALQIQTGQTKNYNPNASEADRATAIGQWQAWLKEYQNNL